MEQKLPSESLRSNDSKLYEVFVAGIPATESIDSVHSYFSSMGSVKNIELLKIGTKSRGNKLPKRFYRLVTDCYLLFSTLVHHPGPLFKGRRLFCQVYKSGDDLASHSADINARRIVIKQVPLATEDDDVRIALRQAGGSLETLYEYKSEVDIKTDYSKFYKTYSATFEATSNISELVEKGTLVLASGDVALIERFLYKRKPVLGSNQKNLPSDNFVAEDKEEKYCSQKGATNKKPEVSGSKRFPVKTAKFGIPKNRKNEGTGKTQDTDADFLKWLEDGYKPTSKKYHLSNKVPEHNYLSMESSAKHPLLRFNICKLQL